jgi:hypothetical protein
VADVTPFGVTPPFRCFGRPELPENLVCGARASWMRPAVNGAIAQFFCDRCKGKNDVAIASDVLFRRLTVSLDVMFAAVDLVPGAARAEAVARLELLVQQAGGVICLHGITEQVGRKAAPLPPGVKTAGKGNRG